MFFRCHHAQLFCWVDSSSRFNVVSLFRVCVMQFNVVATACVRAVPTLSAPPCLVRIWYNPFRNASLTPSVTACRCGVWSDPRRRSAGDERCAKGQTRRVACNILSHQGSHHLTGATRFASNLVSEIILLQVSISRLKLCCYSYM